MSRGFCENHATRNVTEERAETQRVTQAAFGAGRGPGRRAMIILWCNSCLHTNTQVQYILYARTLACHFYKLHECVYVVYIVILGFAAATCSSVAVSCMCCYVYILESYILHATYKYLGCIVLTCHTRVVMEFGATVAIVGPAAKPGTSCTQTSQQVLRACLKLIGSLAVTHTLRQTDTEVLQKAPNRTPQNTKEHRLIPYQTRQQVTILTLHLPRPRFLWQRTPHCMEDPHCTSQHALKAARHTVHLKGIVRTTNEPSAMLCGCINHSVCSFGNAVCGA